MILLLPAVSVFELLCYPIPLGNSKDIASASLRQLVQSTSIGQVSRSRDRLSSRRIDARCCLCWFRCVWSCSSVMCLERKAESRKCKASCGSDLPRFHTAPHPSSDLFHRERGGAKASLLRRTHTHTYTSFIPCVHRQGRHPWTCELVICLALAIHRVARMHARPATLLCSS